MKLLTRTIIAVAALGICLVAWADSRINEVWQCKLKEGKTIEEVRAVNADWLKFTNGNVEGGDVSSADVQPIVGKLDGFLFVDSYPSMEAWAAAKAAGDSDEGKAIEARFNELIDCTDNRLHEFTPN